MGRSGVAKAVAKGNKKVMGLMAVVETLGGWEEQAERQIKRLGAALARHTGQEEAEKTRHLFQRLAVLLAKGNAALFLNRLPSHPSALIDGSN